jgi:hypothetical protein
MIKLLLCKLSYLMMLDITSHLPAGPSQHHNQHDIEPRYSTNLSFLSCLVRLIVASCILSLAVLLIGERLQILVDW